MLRLTPQPGMTWLGLSHVVMGVGGFMKEWEWAGLEFAVLLDGKGVVGEGAVIARPW